jgi:hypothetical protein
MTVTARIATDRAVVAARTVKFGGRPHGRALRCIEVQATGVPQVLGGQDCVNPPGSGYRVEVVVLPLPPGCLLPGPFPRGLAGLEPRQPVMARDVPPWPWVGQRPSAVVRAGHAGVADGPGAAVQDDDTALASQPLASAIAHTGSLAALASHSSRRWVAAGGSSVRISVTRAPFPADVLIITTNPSTRPAVGSPARRSASL